LVIKNLICEELKLAMVRLKADFPFFLTPTFKCLENVCYSPILSSVAKQYSQVEKILEGHLPSCIPQVTLMQQGLYVYAYICNLPSRKFIILDA
jgi:hypothetical protein